MALRVRANGDVVCAAQSYEDPGDTYINDGLQYSLAYYYTDGFTLVKPDTEEDRQWAELYQRCMERGEDPRTYWPPAIAELRAKAESTPKPSPAEEK